MTPLRRFLGQTITMLLMLGSGLLTAFVFANSYETAFNHDLPVAKAIERVNMDPVESVIPANAITADPAKHLGNYGAPAMLRLSAQRVRFPVAPAILSHDTWVARSNTGHYVGVSPAKGGDMGDLVIYVRQGWRTINDPSALVTDANIFVDTDKGWRYMYRITAVSHLSSIDRYLLPESPKTQLVVVLADASTGMTTVARAEFVTLQSIAQ